MHDFRWDHADDHRRIERIDDGGVVYVISDIHLGDGSPSDIFVAKDRVLLEFLDQVDKEDATLVVAGDAIDFSQAWMFTNILKAHGKVLGAFSALAGKGRFHYVLGNHDHDLRLYKDVLRFPVVHGIEVGDHTCILHGYEFDPVIGKDIEAAEYRTKMHHLFERALGTWLRLPLEFHYTWWNRCSFWLFHKAVWFRRRLARFLDSLFDDTRHGRELDETIRYWTRCQMGDPASIFRPAMKALAEGPYETLICGHSHLPGIVDGDEGRRYANTGSWTFASSSVLRIEGRELELRDWLSGRRITDGLYEPLIARRFDHMSFEEWWRDNYLGWLRYRVGEEVREGKLPVWPPS
ncbi:MAG: hypothetical protein GY913_00895 [Proteobacteria bacterium]|nr:hypothetical protein [Pseudomonadota bacterium]MCP4915454.1 hypothetical protein [Pseudomonadota bacterium]